MAQLEWLLTADHGRVDGGVAGGVKVDPAEPVVGDGGGRGGDGPGDDDIVTGAGDCSRTQVAGVRTGGRVDGVGHHGVLDAAVALLRPDTVLVVVALYLS